MIMMMMKSSNGREASPVCGCVLGMIQKWKEESAFGHPLYLPRLSSAMQELLFETFFLFLFFF